MTFLTSLSPRHGHIVDLSPSTKDRDTLVRTLQIIKILYFLFTYSFPFQITVSKLPFLNSPFRAGPVHVGAIVLGSSQATAGS